MRALYEADLDIVYIGLRGEGIHIVADAKDIEYLRQYNVPYEVLHWDLCAFYQSRLDNSLARDLGYGSMGGFYTYSEVAGKLDSLHADYPDLVGQKFSIGQTQQGRQIWAFKVSDNVDVDEDEPEAIIDSLTHAREPQGMMTSLYFVDWVLENYPSDPMAKLLIENREMWFVPVHNADGYYYNESQKPHGGGMWRKNRRNNGDGTRGVDPNRNWGYMWGYDNAGSSNKTSSETYRGPSAMSEPMTQAMANFIIARQPKERMSIHTYSNLWLIPWCYDRIVTPDDKLLRDLAEEMAPGNYDVGTSWETLYEVNGGSLDWDYGDQGIVTFSPEMGSSADGFWPPTSRIVPIAEENLPSLQYYFAVAGAFLKLDSFEFTEVGGNINGYPNAGDTLELVVKVMNRGLEPYSESVPLTLSTSSPHIQILDDSCQVTGMGSRECSDNSTNPFVIEILPSAPYASILEMEVAIPFQGYVQKETVQFLVGTARRSISEDMEAEPLQWQIGLQTDTVLGGAWEWGDPCGTSLAGETIQPEDDFSPMGTRCFVTDCGSPGQEPEDQDVDKGVTTLISPIFDLTDAFLPRLGFRMWWHKEEAGGNRDKFMLSITDDAGHIWWIVDRIFTRGLHEWVDYRLDLTGLVDFTDRMQLRFTIMDIDDDSLLEALVDDLWVESYCLSPLLDLFGELITGSTCKLGLAWEPGYQYWTYISPGKGAGIPLTGGTWYLDPPFFLLLFNGALDSGGRTTQVVPVPDMPELVGSTLFLQSFVVPVGGGGVPLISNCIGAEVK
ncbi:MAG: M14 family metallopeptidase [Planctomycetota bacterium]